jgi:hypothetical protein
MSIPARPGYFETRSSRRFTALSCLFLDFSMAFFCRASCFLAAFSASSPTSWPHAVPRARSPARSGCWSNHWPTYQHIGTIRREEFASTSFTAYSTTSPA